MAKRALVLSGGGARGAFQVGMLKGLVATIPDLDFDIIHGVSAGAINAAFLAQAPLDPARFAEQVAALEGLWTETIVGNDSVYKERLGGEAAALLWAESLYDTAPMREFLTRAVDVSKIRESGRDFEVGAVSLLSGDYIEVRVDTDRAETQDHFITRLMASAALPPVFPPQWADGDFLVDGGMRNITPLGSAIKRGAEEIFALLTSRIVKQHGELPSNSIEGMAAAQWRNNALGTKVKMMDVFGRSYSILMDDVYLEDIERTQQLNLYARAIERLLAAAAAARNDNPALDQVLKSLAGLSKRRLRLNVIAPDSFFDPGGEPGKKDLAVNFTPDLIRNAIAAGERVGRDRSQWLWTPEDDDRELAAAASGR